MKGKNSESEVSGAILLDTLLAALIFLLLSTALVEGIMISLRQDRQFAQLWKKQEVPVVTGCSQKEYRELAHTLVTCKQPHGDNNLTFLSWSAANEAQE